MDWLVLDMDDGVLRREPTRKAALNWFMRFSDASRVLKRHHYGPGAYEYHVGSSQDDQSDVFIQREDVARRAGWDVDRGALYPWINRPFVGVDAPTQLG